MEDDDRPTWILCPLCQGEGLRKMRIERPDGTYKVLENVCNLCGGCGAVHPAVLALWIDEGRPQ